MYRTDLVSWQVINFKELKEYRDLFFFLVWRDVKVLYAQTILGFAWAVLQPLIQILIFTIIFGKVAKISTDGVPYILFSSVAIIPWTYMSQAMTQSSQSLIQGQNMLGKVYFPRLIFPLTPVLAKLVDFAISFLIIACIMIYYSVVPTWNIPMEIYLFFESNCWSHRRLSSLLVRHTYPLVHYLARHDYGYPRPHHRCTLFQTDGAGIRRCNMRT